MDILFCILMGYMLGCFNPAALLSKLKKIDLRKEGSGNLGATNATMVLGKKCGAVVLLCDVAKAFAAVKLAQRLFPAIIAAGLIAGAAAVVGHIYPFYLKFKGGKGLAAFAGFILGVDPILLVILFVFCLGLTILINYSVAAPLSAAVLFPILYGVRTGGDFTVLIITAVGGLIICKFWSNLVKAIRGEDITVREFAHDHLLAKRGTTEILEETENLESSDQIQPELQNYNLKRRAMWDMKKVIRFFGSRFFLGAFCILLEFAQLLAVYILLYQYVLPITILAWVFHFAMLIYLINRDEIPEFKMPWLIIFLLLPVLGSFVFMLLSSNSTSKKEYLRAEKAAKDMEPYGDQTEVIGSLKERDPDAWLQANYIYAQTGMPCRQNTATTYYPIGEEFHAALLDELKKAERFIFMEYFIIQSGKMWNPIIEILREKKAQGVEVYLMYDDLGCLSTLPWHYYKQLNEEGIHCEIANKFGPVLSRIHNSRDHRKITVIDGKVGFTGGINLADEYINAFEKHGHWKDTAVKLEGDAVQNLTMLFLMNWNTQSKKQPIDYTKYMNVQPESKAENGIVIPFGTGAEPICRDSAGKNIYLNMIHAAKRYLYITTPYLICDREMLSALCLAAGKGVDVRIITPHIPDKKAVFWMTRSNYLVLMKAGVRIFEYTPGFIHAKNFVCDDKFAVCGTLNLDYRSLVHHYECGAWMCETDCIADMKEDFLRTEELSGEVDKNKPVMSGWAYLVAGVMKVFSPLL